jgi:hypothetical protein
MYLVRHILNSLKHLMTSGFQQLHSVMTRWTNPLSTSLMLGTVTDLFRSKSQLVAENALLRQQLIILRRQVKRPACTKADRMVLVLLARAVQMWKQVLFIVQPETLLRWHREGFRWFWKRKSKVTSPTPKLAPEIRYRSRRRGGLPKRAMTWCSWQRLHARAAPSSASMITFCRY